MTPYRMVAQALSGQPARVAWVAGFGLVRAMAGASLCAIFLAGCAASSGPRQGVVMDAIHREVAVAAMPVASKPKIPLDIEQSFLPPLQLEPAKKAAAEARFDIAVSNAPASQVFMAIVEGTPYSMLVPPEVTGALTLSLKGVTVREVLDTIRDLYGFDYRVEGNRIFIQPNTIQTRIFKVNYLIGRRDGSTRTTLNSANLVAQSLNDTQSNANGSTASSQTTQEIDPGTGSQRQRNDNAAGMMGNNVVTTVMDNNFWGEVRTALVSLIGTTDGRNVIINPSSGVIMVRATPNELREVERYLKTTQLIVERQVMLEAKIIEVSLNQAYQAGVNWSRFGQVNRSLAGTTTNNAALGMQGSGVTLGSTGDVTNSTTAIALAAGASSIATAASGFYGLAFQSANFAALLSFLESQGDVQVLSSPRVATLNNQKAVLKVGNDEYFVTGFTPTTQSNTQNGTTTTTTGVTPKIDPIFSGITLDVTPQIDEHDQIILHVHPTISQATERSKVINLGTTTSMTIPFAYKTISESDSIVRARDGNIVAIGGLMRQRQSGDRSGLPGTSDQNVTLFGQRERSLSKSELVILIKPTVIREDADWRNSLAEAQVRLQEYAPAAPVRIVGR